MQYVNSFGIHSLKTSKYPINQKTGIRCSPNLLAKVGAHWHGGKMLLQSLSCVPPKFSVYNYLFL